VDLDKPVFIGMAILELSKLLMLEFYYDYFKVKYPDCRLLYTDTDSMIIDVPTEDFYEDMKTELHMYDTSDYPKDHPLYSTVNKKVPGKFKDELNGVPIFEYIGLRSKMYSILHEKGSQSKAKGIQKAAIKNKEIRHDHYKQVLDREVMPDYPNKSIRSNKHNLEVVSTHKKSLAVGDTKRVFHTKEKAYAPGHYKLKLAEDICDELVDELIDEMIEELKLIKT
jgi:hypothetical protein